MADAPAKCVMTDLFELIDYFDMFQSLEGHSGIASNALQLFEGMCTHGTATARSDTCLEL